MKQKNKYIYIFIILIILIIALYIIRFIKIEYYTSYDTTKYEYKITKNLNSIPFVLIIYNSLYFLKNFINQIKKFPNPIIIYDNKSTYLPLLEYYKELKEEYKEQIEIRYLKKNYGHTVYLQFSKELPSIFILSDTDLELNTNMDYNFVEKLLNISDKYKASKVGLALNIDYAQDFISGFDNYIRNFENQYWLKRLNDQDYELYEAKIDTTFCLVNLNYPENMITGLNGYHIRIANNYTCKHLPWYNNYIKHKFSKEELDFWLKNNISSSILKNEHVKKHLSI